MGSGGRFASKNQTFAWRDHGCALLRPVWIEQVHTDGHEVCQTLVKIYHFFLQPLFILKKCLRTRVYMEVMTTFFCLQKTAPAQSICSKCMCRQNVRMPVERSTSLAAPPLARTCMKKNANRLLETTGARRAVYTIACAAKWAREKKKKKR